MIKAIIFDLDNCLAAANEVGEHLFEPAFEAIRNANRGTLTTEPLARHSTNAGVIRLTLSQQIRLFAGNALSWLGGLCSHLCPTPMNGYDDLAFLRELPVELYLVTSGFRRLQESKIKALELRASVQQEYRSMRLMKPTGKASKASLSRFWSQENLRPEKLSWWATIQIRKSKQEID